MGYLERLQDAKRETLGGVQGEIFIYPGVNRQLQRSTFTRAAQTTQKETRRLPLRSSGAENDEDFTSVDPMTAVIQLPTPNLQFAGYWNDPADPECVTYEYIPNDDYGTPDIPATDSSNVCPDGLPPTTNSSCTFTETPITPIEEATPKSSICTTDDVNNMLCPLPLNPGNQCTFTDIIWSL